MEDSVTYLSKHLILRKGIAGVRICTGMFFIRLQPFCIPNIHFGNLNFLICILLTNDILPRGRMVIASK